MKCNIKWEVKVLAHDPCGEEATEALEGVVKLQSEWCLTQPVGQRPVVSSIGQSNI